MRALLALAVVLAAGCLDARDGGGDDARDATACPDPFVTSVDVTVPVMAGGGRLGDTDRYEVPVALGERVPAGFRWSCVRAVEVVLAWTNLPSAGADLYVGVQVPRTGLEAIGHDEQQLAGDGAHTETVVAALGWGPHDPVALADGVTVLVLSDWASLSQSGVPATLTLTLLV